MNIQVIKLNATGFAASLNSFSGSSAASSFYETSSGQNVPIDVVDNDQVVINNIFLNTILHHQDRDDIGVIR